MTMPNFPIPHPWVTAVLKTGALRPQVDRQYPDPDR